MNSFLYAAHRWLAAVAFVQLAAWTLTGAFFAIAPIGRVRGASVPHAHERPLVWQSGMLAPTEALDRAGALGLAEATTLELRSTSAGVFYLARGHGGTVRINARTAAAEPVTRAEAEHTARIDQPDAPHALGAVLVEAATAEYRGKPLPAWRVTVADGAGTAIYVDAVTGDVTARRNDLWRWYDFFWSLHIMDYRERESFNHPLLVAAAVLAVTTVVSGGVLWAVRVRRWLARRRRAVP